MEPESRELEDLDTPFRSKLVDFLVACSGRRLMVELGCTIRTPTAQAKMWCRSRSPAEVKNMRSLIGPSAPIMASLLREEWAGFGPPVTDHLPGQSWHQWGQAADIYCLVEGRAIWTGSAAEAVAEVARFVGLPHSMDLFPPRRHWHVQLNRNETPLMVRGLADSWGDIEKAMLLRWPEELSR